MNRHLALSTVSFALCFAMWGLVGALGPLLRQTFGLTNTEAALLVVVPVLLGSLARIPAGMLTDRLGGRAVFTALMILVAGAAVVIPQVSSYGGLLAGAFFLGLAGASFAVGVGYLAGWTTPTGREQCSAFTDSERSVSQQRCFSDHWQLNPSVGKTSSTVDRRLHWLGRPCLDCSREILHRGK